MFFWFQKLGKEAERVFGKLHFQYGGVGFFVPTDEDVISTKEKSQDDHAAEIGQPIGEKDRHSHQAGQSFRLINQGFEEEIGEGEKDDGKDQFHLTF